MRLPVLPNNTVFFEEGYILINMGETMQFNHYLTLVKKLELHIEMVVGSVDLDSEAPEKERAKVERDYFEYKGRYFATTVHIGYGGGNAVIFHLALQEMDVEQYLLREQ